MKTLKKTLCLILAVVMVVGVLILPAYAADDYTDAITDLQNYKVLQGKGDGLIHADDPVTRADMAAIVYRIMTGDTEPAATANQKADAKYGAYADKFKDLTANDQWAKGYIGFCANQGVLKGDEKGNVKPNQQITGYEVQAMLLRAIGYDRNNEYTGSNWEYKVLADATKTGISKGVSTDPANKTPRGAVAQLTYNAATQTNRVAPAIYPTVGYASLGESLIEEGTTTPGADKWGAPSTIYNITFTWPDNDVNSKPEVPDKALLETWEPVTEADVYAAAGLTSTANKLEIYLNGKDNHKASDAIGTGVTLMGGQGRWTRVYADRIVYVDTFLTRVTDVVDEVKVNGKTAIAASYDVNAYSNNYSVPATAAAQTFKSSNTPSALLLGAAPISYAKGDMLASYGVSNRTGGAAFNADNGIKSLVGAAKAATETVTVNAIVKKGGAAASSAAIVGLIGTNGKTYLYNCTYSYNAADWANSNWVSTTRTSAGATRLTDIDIGKTYTLYLDAHGNILGLKEVTSAGDKGVGVVTKASVYRIDAAQYAVELTVLTENNTTTTIRALSSHAVYADEGTAKTAADGYLGDLIKWSPDTTAAANGLTGYSDVNRANSGTPAAVAAGTTTEMFAGDAKKITDGDTNLLCDDTVFFIANYVESNSLNGYKFTGYSVVKGYKNIPDLSVTSSDELKGAPSDYGTTMTSIYVNYFSDADGIWADYVLVVNATSQSTNTKVPVTNNYAFLANPDKFVKVYDPYYEYTAVINGTPNQPLKVQYRTSTVINTGLYSYSELTNGAWKNVAIVTNSTVGAAGTVSDGTGYAYHSGVLYVMSNGYTTSAQDPSSVSAYHPVIDNVPIYLVDPDTGASTRVNMDLGTVQDAYHATTNKIWWTVNEYGYINLIYVEVPDVGSAVTGKDIISSGVNTKALPKVTEDDAKSTTISSYLAGVEVDGTEASKYSITGLKVEKLANDGVTWEKCNGSEIFNKDAYSYRLVVTFTVKGNNIFQTPTDPGLGTNLTNGKVIENTGDTLTVQIGIEISA